MASIKSQMTLNDGMSAVINRITKSLQTLTGSFVAVQQASANGVNTRNFEAANSTLVRQINLAEQLANEFGGVADETERIRKNIEGSTSKTDDLMSKVSGVVTKLGIAAGAKKLLELSDQQASTTARLTMLVDDGGSVSALERQIFASAMRSRSAYQSTADAVSSLGLNAAAAFKDAEGKLDMRELIQFTELVNKQFVIGGASAQDQSNAWTQLRQALSAGALRGEELNTILDNAPGIARSIEQYMGAAEGSIKQLAEKGLVTASVVKNAMFRSADDINAKFESMPLTWGQVWTMASNIILRCLRPVLTAINWFANNLSIIGPLVLGLGAAFLVFQFAAHWTQIASAAMAAYHFVVNLVSIGFGVLSGSTAAASAAVMTFNSALFASPITWIVLAVLLLVAAFYAAVAAVNKFAGTSASATGMICGAFMVAIAVIWNAFLALLDLALAVINHMVNPWLVFANFFGNLFNDPVGAVIHLFGDLADNVLGVIESIAKAIDKVFGLNLAGAVQNWRSGLDGMVETAAAKYGNGSYEEIMGELNLSSESLGLSRWAYGDAYDTGWNFGNNLENSFGGGDGFNYDELMGNVGAINENTDAMAGGLDVSNEQLEYLRDIAERDAVNRFTTAEVKIDMTGMTNKISGSADLDGVISGLTEGFAASLLTAAEGVPA